MEGVMKMAPKRLKVVTSHVGFARFLAECAEEPVGEIPRIPEIPTPYAHSPAHVVWAWGEKKVIVAETRHKRYEVFEVPAGTAIVKGEV